MQQIKAMKAHKLLEASTFQVAAYNLADYKFAKGTFTKHSNSESLAQRQSPPAH